MKPLAAQVAALFDAPVAAAATDPRVHQPDVLPVEAAHVARAIDKRQREFAAGRAAARQAMAELTGQAQDLAIPAAEDRSPIWPDGWQGSISHKNTLCVAVVGRTGALLGLDLEEDTPLKQDLIPTICTPAEMAAIAGPQERRLAKLIFSAKEAAYKAQYPVTQKVFGFLRFEVRLDVPGAAFTARFVEDTGRFMAGDALAGRFFAAEGHLVTGVTIGQSDHLGIRGAAS